MSRHGDARRRHLNADFARQLYLPGSTHPTAGGVSGTFAPVVNRNLPPDFDDSLSYDANDAYLDLTLNFAASAGSTAISRPSATP